MSKVMSKNMKRMRKKKLKKNNHSRNKCRLDNQSINKKKRKN